jgi:hypothetical protein
MSGTAVAVRTVKVAQISKPGAGSSQFGKVL